MRFYLKKYVTVAGGGTYIDGFAGTGICTVRGQEWRGSPIIACKSEAFKTVHCFDKPRELATLQKRVEYLLGDKARARFRFHPGDMNKELPALLETGTIPPAKPCFAFLDPNSTELAWSTIQALASYKAVDTTAHPPLCKIELWILFNSGQAINRLWLTDRNRYTMPAGPDAFDRIFGGRDSWIDLWRDHKPATHLVLRYQELLRGLRYGSVNLYELRRPGTAQLQYHMLHATDHAAAVNFMSWAQGVPTAEVVKAPELKFPKSQPPRMKTTRPL